MGDIEMQINHSNIADVVLGRIRKYFGKRTRHITEKEKKQNKCYFENEKGVFRNERLARDVIERCKLPEAIELRKKLGYNHDNIMVRQETSIAEKIIKLFPYENIVLNKNLKVQNQIFGLKICTLLSKLMKEIMKITRQTMKKKEKACLKDVILKSLSALQMILGLILINFLAN